MRFGVCDISETRRKSLIFFFLVGREVAIVSSIAGTTRDIIEVTMDVKGIPIILHDTAGLRESFHILEQEGIRRAQER
jgi:tRNA modification GTPase